MKVLKILIACEESQAICKEFRALGHEAWSCDLQKCSGGYPKVHINGNCLSLLNGDCDFVTQDGTQHHHSGKWDMIIAHPPCTFLTVTGNRWFNVERYGVAAIKRAQDREEAIEFFMQFTRTNCEHVAIENPIGVMSTCWRKADQYIQPYQFGDPFEKKTALWLIGLPPLTPTNVVVPPPRTFYESGKSAPTWYADAVKLPKEERAKLRSKTFPGIAKAIAKQWSEYLVNKN